jgi:hypothetical protein
MPRTTQADGVKMYDRKAEADKVRARRLGRWLFEIARKGKVLDISRGRI